MAENIDQDELKKFAKNSDEWWDLHGEFKPLHDINPLRLEFIKRHSLLNAKNVLDVGCGGGILSEAMAQAGATVVGIDATQKAITAAEEHLKVSKLNIKYHCERVESLAAQKPETYDIITCMEMLEHVPQPEAIINSCATLLKPGGSFYMSTINRNPKAFLFAIVGAEYLLNLIPKGTHRYEKLLKPAEVTTMARAASLTPKASAGLSYHLLTKKYYLTDNIDVNYMLHFKKYPPKQ